MICATAQDAAMYAQRYPGVFDSIRSTGNRYDQVFSKPVDREKLLVQAQRYEKEFGINLNYHIMASRHLGRGYSPLGIGNPRSKLSESFTYWTRLSVILGALNFWEKEFSSVRYSLIIVGAGDKQVSELARVFGIPLRILIETRHSDYFCWAVNEFQEHPYVHAIAKDCEGNLDAAKAFSQAPLSHLKLTARLLEGLTFWNRLRRTAYLCAKELYCLIRGFDKAKYGYLLSDNIANAWRRYFDWKRLVANRLVTLKDIKDLSFVYYPLHTEPEIALGLFSPEFTDQMCVIQTISRALPVDTHLVVKEHVFGIGQRPRDFYRQLQEIHNVIFLDPRESGIDVIRSARGVVTISGTSGLEAAMLGKPVMAFGRHNNHNSLPHVHCVRDFDKIPFVLNEKILKGNIGPDAVRASSRYLEALKKISFRYDCCNPTLSPDLLQEALGRLELSLSSAPALPASSVAKS
ncbi:hypothetical protein ACFL6Y_04705 [Elusimicrobiota bacterium]